jgi:hypothetical protein
VALIGAVMAALFAGFGCVLKCAMMTPSEAVPKYGTILIVI